MIEITDNTIAMWFIRLTEESDCTGALNRIGESEFEFIYRFRYYVVEEAFDHGWDTKNWYKTTMKETTKEKALELTRKVLSGLEELSGNKMDEITGEKVEDFLEALRSKPWAHMKKLDEREIDN